MNGKKTRRKIAVIIGSSSDLLQTVSGLSYLEEMVGIRKIEVVGVHTSSIHRNTLTTLGTVEDLARSGVDIIIAGAGWANHLTGMIDAYLRYHLRNTKIVVVGVAFLDGQNLMHNTAAMLSISEVPKHQVVFGPYNGPDGFLKACKFAAEGQLPTIKLPDAKPSITMSLKTALRAAHAATEGR